MDPVRFAVVGVKNFALQHVRVIQELEKEGLVRLVGVVAVAGNEDAPVLPQLVADGVRVFRTYEQLLVDGKGVVDIITLPVSICSHADMAIAGMEAGYDIVLEKPPAPTIDEVDELIAAEQRTGRTCSVGFQHIYAPSLQRLKEMAVNREFGTVQSIAAKGCWPRLKGYYQRNEWAGRSFWRGRLVLDGPMHNAFAHFLNNMLYLASPEPDQSADVLTVRAEMYRAHSYIQADDTSCLEVTTRDGPRIFLFVTHASNRQRDPVIEIVGTKARAIWKYGEPAHVEYVHGDSISIDDGQVNPWKEVMRVAALVHRGARARPCSTLENSRSFTVAINGSYYSCPRIIPVPEKWVYESIVDGDVKTELLGIDNLVDQAFAASKLLSELGVEWTVATEAVDVSDLTEFNPFR